MCGLDMTHRRDLGFLSNCSLGDPRPSPRVEAQGGVEGC